MKKIYIAVQIRENDKYYAYAIPVTDADNLLVKLQIKGIVSANICTTKKAARDLVTRWNAVYKANNKFMFDETF
jgi:hypothetical protein